MGINHRLGLLLSITALVVVGYVIFLRYERMKLTQALAQKIHEESDVRGLLEQGADPNAVDENGMPLIIHTIDPRNPGTLRLFVERGADVNARGRSGDTPLSVAVARGLLEVVRFLVEKGADVNRKGREGMPPLALAGMNGDTEMVQFLLARGARIEEADDRGFTPLIRAADRGQTHIVKLLVEKGAQVNARTQDGYTALMRAAAGGHAETVRYLTSRGADVNAQAENGMTALLYASAAGAEDVLRILLEKGAHINAADSEGRTALMHLEMRMIEGRPTSGGLIVSSPGPEASQGFRSPRIASSARSAPGGVPADNARIGNVALLRFLLDRGADVHAASKDGQTVLMHTIRRANILGKKMRLHRAAYGRAPQNAGMKAVLEEDASLLRRYAEVVQQLIDRGADVNRRDDLGRSALSLANEFPETQLSALLKKAGAKE